MKIQVSKGCVITTVIWRDWLRQYPASWVEVARRAQFDSGYLATRRIGKGSALVAEWLEEHEYAGLTSLQEELKTYLEQERPGEAAASLAAAPLSFGSMDHDSRVTSELYRLMPPRRQRGAGNGDS